jgi:hypothetical protein
MHTHKYRHKDFWSNQDPGKIRKGKTIERGEAFYYSELREKIFTAVMEPQFEAGKEKEP